MKKFLASLLFLLLALPVSAQIPGGSEIQINRTPITGGTNGLCLYQTSTGKVGEQACGTGTAANIQVGTTTVGGGTTTRLLYDNAGVLGETSGITWNGSQLLFPNGTVAAPGIALSAATGTGFWRDIAAGGSLSTTIGIASDGKRVMAMSRVDNPSSALSGTIIRFSDESPTVFTDTSYRYLVTFHVPQQYMGATNAALIPYNLFPTNVELTVPGTFTTLQFGGEIDKLEYSQSGGAASISAGALTIRHPISKTGVTLTRSIGINFDLASSAENTGTITDLQLIRFGSTSGAFSANYYGLWFDAVYSPGGHIGSASSVPLTLNATGSTNVINLQANSKNAFQVQESGASGNFIAVSSNNTPTVAAAGSTNVGLQLTSKGTGTVSIMTNNTGVEGFRVSHTASGVNFINVVPAASGSNASIRASAENLLFGSGAAIATSATAGYIMIPATAGTPTGVPTGTSAGAIALIYDTSTDTLWAYNSGWKRPKTPAGAAVITWQ